MPISKGEKQKSKYKPESVIDENVFLALCKVQCTQAEICDVLGVDDKTLTAWCKKKFGKGFKGVYEQKRATGKVSLRRMQWKSAEAGNPAMQIWLGKQYLGQRDKFPEEEDDKIAQPINITLMPYDASKPDSPPDSTPG